MLTKTILAAVDWGQYNMEDSIKELEEELCREDVAKDHVKLAEISKALTEKKDDLDEKYESWLQLQE